MTKSEKRSGHPYQSELKEKIREKIKQENISALIKRGKIKYITCLP